MRPFIKLNVYLQWRSSQKDELRIESGDFKGATGHSVGNESGSTVSKEPNANCGQCYEENETSQG